MGNKILLLMVFLSVSIAYACVFPPEISFFHDIDLSRLKDSLDSLGKKYTVQDSSVVINYEDYNLVIAENGIGLTCKEIGELCVDNSTFRSLLEDLESWNVFDLSKDDKDIIASLVQKDIVVRKLSREKLLGVKIKAVFLKIIGKVICTNYEEVSLCEGEWCSLKSMKGGACPVLKCG